MIQASSASPHTFAFPVLIGDIGGTNARFGIVSEPGAAFVLLEHVKVADYPNPEAAIAAVLTKHKVAPASAFLAVAGPVEGTAVPLTNAPWIVDAEAIGKHCKFKSASLINDFPPIAASLPHLEAEGGARRIGPDCPALPGGACIAIGPGTGCGAAALVPAGDMRVLLPTEVGHTHLGPEGPEELALWPYIDSNGPMSVETILCGAGLVNLFTAMLRSTGAPVQRRLPHEVLELARTGDPLAMRTIKLFVNLLGRVAGDLALLFQATGGVYIAGGIAPRIVDIIEEGGFRRSFETKPPLTDFMRKVPTFVIVEANPALRGLAAIASAPERHVVPARHWVAAATASDD